jgi:hypothetical protein
LCWISPAWAAMVCSWGEQRFDGADFIDARFQAVTAGWEHSLALKSDGSIVGVTVRLRLLTETITLPSPRDGTTVLP